MSAQTELAQNSSQIAERNQHLSPVCLNKLDFARMDVNGGVSVENELILNEAIPMESIATPESSTMVGSSCLEAYTAVDDKYHYESANLPDITVNTLSSPPSQQDEAIIEREEPEHESVSQEKTVQTELVQISSPIAEIDQPLSLICPDEFKTAAMDVSGGVSVDNELIPESSNMVESSCLEAYTTFDDKYQYESANLPDITVNTFSSPPSQQDASMEDLAIPESSNLNECLEGYIIIDDHYRFENASGGERTLSLPDITEIRPSSPETPIPLQNTSLPFIKASPLWEALESNDVFCLMPQQPHFHPLEQHNEEAREGYALGSILTFTNLVERTRKSKLEDPKRLFENKLNALTDLEELGFTVQPLRTQLEEMLKQKVYLMN